ncbi:MAG TPA: hypothetical protein VNM14_24050 [Planctomycetota bacterium]|nr:hypothetical protein [Planctomycetota bacterium]
MRQCILRALSVIGIIGATAGCALAPASAPWRDDQKVIAAHPAGAMGYLTVETQEYGSPDEGVQPHQRFYVYDQSGRYLDYYPNDLSYPISLVPGKYVVVSRYCGRNKRVQVEIKDGYNTYVTLNDFKQAPMIE